MQKVYCKMCGTNVEIQKLSDKYYIYTYHKDKLNDNNNCPNSGKKVK